MKDLYHPFSRNSLSYVAAIQYESGGMRAEADQYKVRPRKSRDGWNLESDRLSHGLLWYQKETDAVSYAQWNSRVNGCRIEILNAQNRVVRTEEFSSGDFAY